MVRGIRIVEASLGDGVKRPSPAEAETAAVARKSVVASVDIAAGAVIDREMLAVRRPGTGLRPMKLEWVAGRRARKAIPSGTVITEDMV
jgi:N-acetylneuraminate synthase/N,N'-diacetyllegionaminate synthase